MYAGRLTLDEAHDYLKRRRPLISPNLNFMRQLSEFEARLAAGEDCFGKVGLGRPSEDLMSFIASRCSSQLCRTMAVAESGPAFCPMVSDNCIALPKPRSGLQVESDVRKKRKALSDLLLPCGPAAAKVPRIGLQPPPTPCMKQAFVFDLATVAVLMSGHGTAGSPTMSQSPLVSPS